MLSEIEAHLYSISKPKSISQILGLEKTATEFCASLVLRYLRTGEVQVKQDTTISINGCLIQLRILPKFHRMFRFLLSLLSQVGAVSIEGEQVVFLERSLSLLSPEAWLDKIRTLYPKFHFFFAFLEKCSRFYPEVLSGRKPATEVLFPQDDPFILKKLYENTPKIGHEDFYLHLAKEFLRSQLQKESNLIEIGGGQGILTQLLLPELHENLNSYLFTDIGPSFLKDASFKWGTQYPKFHTLILDVSLSPDTQGFKPHSFDALVGFNVIHATSDIIETIEHCFKLVKEEGVMCFIETVKQQAWIDMIYGLTDGWWLFNDSIRTHSPLLSIEQWQQSLAQYGNVTVLPIEKNIRSETDTALILIEPMGHRTTSPSRGRLDAHNNSQESSASSKSLLRFTEE